MSSYRREVWATLSHMLRQVEEKQATTAVTPDLTHLQEEVRKLGKTQFKANMLAEAQTNQWQTLLDELSATQAQNRDLAQALQNQQQQTADQAFLLSLLPILDDLEQALANGRSQADNPTLSNWLDGIRLIYDRFLAILERNGVNHIPAVGKSFDPYFHRAVGTVSQLSADATAVAPNTIISEERRGYQTAVGVLRYADVIVYKPVS